MPLRITFRMWMEQFIMKRYVILMILFTTSLLAYTIHVPSDYSLIHDAIGAAQDGDTVLVAPGLYTGGFSFRGKNIVVRSSDGFDVTFLRSPWPDWYCVKFKDGEDSTAVLEGFSITNWEFDRPAPSDRSRMFEGGGIYITNSSPTIRNCSIVNCSSEIGAGLYLQHSSMRVSNCLFLNNYAVSYGGGLFIGSSDKGIPPMIIGCTIDGNEAQDGGGLYIWGDTAVVLNNVISNNDASGIGNSSTSLLIGGNLITGNSASGIRINSGSAIIIGNMIVENTAGLGGGIYENSINTIHIDNNTIAYNTATSSGGWGGGLISWRDSLVIRNSVFWGNTAVNGSQISLPATTNPSTTIIDYSNIQYGEDSMYLGSIAVLEWGSGNIDADPLFETGPICDYHLSMSSPCVDAGNPDPIYSDPEDPFNPGYALWPAMGYLRNDMGAFGGGGVGYWLSVEEEEQASSPVQGLNLVCYPNPSPGAVSIVIPDTFMPNSEILVYDISGKLVRRFSNLDSGVVQWDCEDGSGIDVPSGVYLIQAISDGVSEITRLVKL